MEFALVGASQNSYSTGKQITELRRMSTVPDHGLDRWDRQCFERTDIRPSLVSVQVGAKTVGVVTGSIFRVPVH